MSFLNNVNMYLLIPRAALRFVSQQKEKGCQIIRQYWRVDKNSNRRWCCSNVTVNTNNCTLSTGDLTETRDIMTSHDKKPFQRLPKTISPYHYEISLSPDLKNFVFQGSENIYIDVKESTKTVVLNSSDIEIKNAVFHNKDGSELTAEKIDVSNSEETATLLFPQELPLGKTGHLSIVFQGEINDKMKGLYRSKYNRPDGTIAHAAVTQFEPTDARRCFPCWDEPAHKSKFDITLTVPSSLTVLSNMPVKTRTKESDSTEVLTFETTPVMSTYLVAVVVGEFDYVEGTSSDGVLVRVYTPKSKSEQGLFALEVATKVLPYYKEYFGIAYPLPKIDLIAIPDFSSGAMENWGLVTYRETCLLVDPRNTSSVRKQWIALVVAHELAHQWFGNLVTMEWWTHLWLNEGYASFVEFLCVAHLFPEYDIWTQFVTDTHIRALELDGLKHSHPIEVPVGHPSEIDEIFDEISYNKGACVIRMLHSYIGDDDFRKGMNLYLNRYSYSNAETENLWAALEEASKKSVRSVMSAWTKKQGFPVIKVEQRQEGDDRVLSLSQERFLADGSTQEDEDVSWIIPVNVSTAKDPKEIAVNTIMDSRTAEIRIKDLPADQWAKLNPGTIGFYRTRYTPEALALLLPAIEDNSLPPLDRLGLLDDLFAIVQAGHASTNQVLELIQAFQHEENYTVWSSIVNCLSKISVLISHLEEHSNFKAYSRNLMTDICKKLGWEPKPNESHLDTLLRPLVLGRMAAMEDQETIRECQRRFELHVSGEQILAADLRSPVYRGVLATGDAQIFETMLKLYKEADLHEEKDRIMRVLGTVKNESLLPRVLEFSLSEHVRAQDSIFTIIPVTSTYKGRLLTWQFFKDNWKTLVDRYGGTFLITRLTKHTTENFVTEEQAKEVEAFFQTHPIPGTERCMQQSVETIRLNAAWLKRDEEAIKDFLVRSTTA